MASTNSNKVFQCGCCGFRDASMEKVQEHVKQCVLLKPSNLSETKEIENNNNTSQNQEIHLDGTDFNFRWPKKAVAQLIELYKKHQEEFESTLYTNKSVWTSIGKEMVSKGYIVSGTQCDTKWRGLKKIYRKLKAQNLESDYAYRKWPFYADMEEIYNNYMSQKSVATTNISTPRKTISTINSSTSFFSLNDMTSESDDNSHEADLNDDDEVPKKKRRQSRIELQLKMFEKLREDKERRHQETMAIRRELLTTLKEILIKLK